MIYIIHSLLQSQIGGTEGFLQYEVVTSHVYIRKDTNYIN